MGLGLMKRRAREASATQKHQKNTEERIMAPDKSALGIIPRYPFQLVVLALKDPRDKMRLLLTCRRYLGLIDIIPFMAAELSMVRHPCLTKAGRVGVCVSIGQRSQKMGECYTSVNQWVQLLEYHVDSFASWRNAAINAALRNATPVLNALSRLTDAGTFSSFNIDAKHTKVIGAIVRERINKNRIQSIDELPVPDIPGATETSFRFVTPISLGTPADLFNWAHDMSHDYFDKLSSPYRCLAQNNLCRFFEGRPYALQIINHRPCDFAQWAHSIVADIDFRIIQHNGRYCKGCVDIDNITANTILAAVAAGVSPFFLMESFLKEMLMFDDDGEMIRVGKAAGLTVHNFICDDCYALQRDCQMAQPNHRDRNFLSRLLRIGCPQMVGELGLTRDDLVRDDYEVLWTIVRAPIARKKTLNAVAPLLSSDDVVGFNARIKDIIEETMVFNPQLTEKDIEEMFRAWYAHWKED
jgi:hypothetical protein